MSSQFRLKCLFGTASLFSFQEEVAQVLKTKYKKKKKKDVEVEREK